ncbi:hypothetical protein KIPB_009953 [Kipferlia bialata]|uniref:Uncharacterized protein n=1 Tax=Kipferlia bialata TaxID=797122 RepID=A0A9K3D2J2_9EUKA|nr:hypothetical protein KIPB_009953 [Kipferlia bialata]|eukprot:g9953.t1
MAEPEGSPGRLGAVETPTRAPLTDVERGNQMARAEQRIRKVLIELSYKRFKSWRNKPDGFTDTVVFEMDKEYWDAESFQQYIEGKIDECFLQSEYPDIIKGSVQEISLDGDKYGFDRPQVFNKLCSRTKAIKAKPGNTFKVSYYPVGKVTRSKWEEEHKPAETSEKDKAKQTEELLNNTIQAVRVANPDLKMPRAYWRLWAREVIAETTTPLDIPARLLTSGALSIQSDKELATVLRNVSKTIKVRMQRLSPVMVARLSKACEDVFAEFIEDLLPLIWTVVSPEVLKYRVETDVTDIPDAEDSEHQSDSVSVMEDTSTSDDDDTVTYVMDTSSAPIPPPSRRPAQE